MLLDPDDSQLVLVDYQARLMPAIHDGALALPWAAWIGSGHAALTACP